MWSLIGDTPYTYFRKKTEDNSFKMAKHLGLPAVVFLALCCHLCRCQVNIDPNLEVELQFSVVLERNSSITTATTTPTQESTAISTGIISSDGTASPMAPETTSSTVKESAAASSTEPETTSSTVMESTAASSTEPETTTSTVMESTAASSTEPETTTSTVMESTVTITVSAMETSENTATSEQYETVSTEDPDTNASDTSNETFSDQLLANDWESESFLQEQLANVEAQDNEEIRKPLEDYLKGLYNTTIGYRNLTIQTLLDDGKTVGYSVDYNVKELSEDGSLADDGQLHADLKRVLDELDWDFGDFLIDKEETTNKMKVEIDTVFEVTFGREKLCDLIGNDICSNTSQCDIGQGQVKCQEKCERYLERYTKCNTASLAVVFVKGDCQLDGDKNPFCDCGKSPGDVLRNFFDGEQCVSAAFIVGFSATAGGVILVSLLSAVIVLAVSNSNKSKKLKKMSEDDGPPIWAGKNGANPSGHHVLNEYDNAGFQGNGGGHSFHEEASHDNHSYKPDVDDPEAMSHHSDGPKITSTADNLPDADDTNQQIIELMETDTVKNFQPHVSHIDSTVDYSIKRPTISIKSPSSNASDRVYHEYETESARL